LCSRAAAAPRDDAQFFDIRQPRGKSLRVP
jgi:hypothetical protein